MPRIESKLEITQRAERIREAIDALKGQKFHYRNLAH